jgi:hypothetical protein
MAIKIVALDVYGAILCSDDGDWSFPPRRGLEGFLDECDKKGIITVTSSDADIQAVKRDLGISFRLVPERGLSVERFSNFFCLNQMGEKDFYLIINHYKIQPSELFVIDDREEHISAALHLGSKAVQCPEYRTDGEREWDFSKIKL